VNDQSARRRSADKEQEHSLFKSTDGKNALLQIRNCFLHSVLFSDGEEKHGFTMYGVVFPLYGNTFNKTTGIQ
jgi:hypothetical protein